MEKTVVRGSLYVRHPHWGWLWLASWGWQPVVAPPDLT